MRDEGVSEQVPRLPGVHVVVVGADELNILCICPVFGFFFRGYPPDDTIAKERVVWLKEGCETLFRNRDEKFVADYLR